MFSTDAAELFDLTSPTSQSESGGIAFQKGQPQPLTLRVRAVEGTTLYRLERWE